MRAVCFSAILAGLSLMSGGGACAAPFQAIMLDPAGKPLSDAVITLSGKGSKAAAPLTADMDQRNQVFVPHVLVVRTGTPVRFPNSDDIRHQVYSFSTAKRFELRLYGGTPSAPVLFDKPGLVVLGCNIHDWMLGYVYVTDDPWFAVSDTNGAIQLDVPPGHYTVTLWHPRLPDMLPVSAGTLDLAAAGLRQRFTLNARKDHDDHPAAPAPSAFGDAFHKAMQP